MASSKAGRLSDGGGKYDPEFNVSGKRAHLRSLLAPAEFLCGRSAPGYALKRRGEPVCRACSKTAARLDTEATDGE